MQHKQRHLGRELALQWLFQIDVGGQPAEEVLAEVPDELEGVEEEGVGFAQQLVRGTLEHRPRIDHLIRTYTKGWELSRIASIDRNVLRLAFYQLLFMPEIPASVVADEAVELAKQYSTDESGKFVNGILGAYLRDQEKAGKEADGEG